jgi:hypothetical protein
MHKDIHSLGLVGERFGHVFREALKKAYGRLPSAAFVAAQFNLHCTGTTAVSQESARRWIRGCSIPDPDRLLALSRWLRIDYNLVFQDEKRDSGRPSKFSGCDPLSVDSPTPIADLCAQAVSGLDRERQALVLEFLSSFLLQPQVSQSNSLGSRH